MKQEKRTERLQVMLEPEELAAIDAWRFDNRLPTRAAAIRELLRLGMHSEYDERPGRVTSRGFGVLKRK